MLDDDGEEDECILGEQIAHHVHGLLRLRADLAHPVVAEGPRDWEERPARHKREHHRSRQKLGVAQLGGLQPRRHPRHHRLRRHLGQHGAEGGARVRAHVGLAALVSRRLAHLRSARLQPRSEVGGGGRPRGRLPLRGGSDAPPPHQPTRHLVQEAVDVPLLARQPLQSRLRRRRPVGARQVTEHDSVVGGELACRLLARGKRVCRRGAARERRIGRRAESAERTAQLRPAPALVLAVVEVEAVAREGVERSEADGGEGEDHPARRHRDHVDAPLVWRVVRARGDARQDHPLVGDEQRHQPHRRAPPTEGGHRDEEHQQHRARHQPTAVAKPRDALAVGEHQVACRWWCVGWVRACVGACVEGCGLVVGWCVCGVGVPMSGTNVFVA